MKKVVIFLPKFIYRVVMRNCKIDTGMIVRGSNASLYTLFN